MVKHANDKYLTGEINPPAVEPESLVGTTAKPCPAHWTGENEQKEYSVPAPKKGKVGAGN